MKKIISIFFFLLSIASMNGQTCNCWIPLEGDSTFQIVPITESPNPADRGVPPKYYNDNGSTLPIKLPFDFCFYGQSFNTIFINNNGNVSFKKPIYNFTNGPFPLGTDTLMLAPYFADADSRGGSKLLGADMVYYKITPTCMIVKWNGIGFYDSPLSPIDNDNQFNWFQLIITNGTDPILPPGNNVSFCYRNIMWTSSDTTGGFGGYDGVPATVGVNKGDKTNYAQFGTFTKPGTQYNGPFGVFNGTDWLNNKSFIFNTCINDNTIAPVILKTEETCDSVFVCETDTALVTAAFISPKKGQTCTLSASSPDLTGITVLGTTTLNNITSGKIQITLSAKDVGIHELNVNATDNSVPVQTHTQRFIVIVKDCNVGIDEKMMNGNVTVFPNPSNGDFVVKMDEPMLVRNNRVVVYNTLGLEIYSVILSGNRTDIHLSGFPKGVYFLKIYKENTLSGIKKIMIQ